VLALVTPYIIAGGTDLLTMILLFIIGHAIHYFSFGHNTLMDYWLDINDPSKSHHPLPSGRIRLSTATEVVLYGQIITFVVVMLMCIHFSNNPVLSLFFLGIYLSFGHGYNDGLDHRSLHSWFPISACYAGFVLITYTFVRGLDVVAALIALWAFIAEVYDIALLGNVKDLWNPAEEVNLLRRYVTNTYYVMADGKTVIQSYTLRKDVVLFFWMLRGIINTAILYMLLSTLGLPLMNYVLMTVLTAMEMFSITLIATNLIRGDYSRDELLSLFGLNEAVEFFRFTALTPLWAAGLLITYGLTYFVTFNKYLWGTRLGPKV